MVDGKSSNEVPFGVAVVFTLIGAGMFLGFVLGWVGPALWVRFVDRPTVATVLETWPTKRSGGKGWPVRGLAARLALTVDGRGYQAWVDLPLTTRQTKGPEAESVRTQVMVGQRLPCFYNPLNPGRGVVVERTKLEWSMLFGTLFPLIFLVVGVGGMASSWKRTFPRGVFTEASEVARRLPRSLYLNVLGAAVFGAAGVGALVGTHSGIALLALFGAVPVVVVLVRRAALIGKVAWPSPERRAALGREAGHPSAGEQPARPAIASWAPQPIAVGRGERLAVRLSP